jgi:hypothetical protein
VRLVAQLILALPGGAVSDRLDRRADNDHLRYRPRRLAGCAGRPRARAPSELAGRTGRDRRRWRFERAFDPSAMAALLGIVADQQLERAWQPW